MRLPAHLRANPRRLRDLRRFANGLRILYGAPVWLCGSALVDINAEPRDWDIRITLPDEDFAAKYGGGNMALAADGQFAVLWQWVNEGTTGDWTKLRLRWSDDCVKRAREGWKSTGLNIDFQVYPQMHVRHLYRNQPRLRLDALRPERAKA